MKFYIPVNSRKTLQVFLLDRCLTLLLLVRCFGCAFRKFHSILHSLLRSPVQQLSTRQASSPCCSLQKKISVAISLCLGVLSQFVIQYNAQRHRSFNSRQTACSLFRIVLNTAFLAFYYLEGNIFQQSHRNRLFSTQSVAIFVFSQSIGLEIF